jgi:hypothetical protein
VLRQVAHPPRRLVGDSPERRAGGLPQPRQETGDDVERLVLSDSGERRPRTRAFEQERVPLRVVAEQSHRALAVPDPERLALVFALAVRELDLQDDVARR